ncbi:MAG TPA: DUF2271 domain-containing protein [Chiayiivirga sp.]|jgi:hypothetical protein|nr:DUF2271 domain-containing protein [Chiayiivirga sp.]
MKRLLLSALLLNLIPATHAAQLSLDVEIPQLKVAEYHRPYVAIWIEREDASVAANLAVWYQLDKANDKGESGTKWLPDLRQWWRRSGRSLSLPVDGVTGATRPVGVQRLQWDDREGALKELAHGNYQLVVEAVREVGGRELLKLPFTWPPSQASQSDAQGHSELGHITLQIQP